MKLSMQKTSQILSSGLKTEVLLGKIDEIQGEVCQDVLSLDLPSSKEHEAESSINEEYEAVSSSGQDFVAASPPTGKTEADYEEELQLLNKWYRLDENCIPANYRLQPTGFVCFFVF